MVERVDPEQHVSRAVRRGEMAGVGLRDVGVVGHVAAQGRSRIPVEAVGEGQRQIPGVDVDGAIESRQRVGTTDLGQGELVPVTDV